MSSRVSQQLARCHRCGAWLYPQVRAEAVQKEGAVSGEPVSVPGDTSTQEDQTTGTRSCDEVSAQTTVEHEQSDEGLRLTSAEVWLIFLAIVLLMVAVLVLVRIYLT